MMKVFLTGAAGFIGFHTAQRLLDDGNQVFGYDSVNDYYDLRYKNLRLEKLKTYPQFQFQKGLLEDKETLSSCYQKFSPTHVVNLAAQAGVRYSIENPDAYINSNIIGFQNIIELVRYSKPENFVYASSSSVYGGNTEYPFSEKHEVNNPISLYAATKLSNELVAKSYSNLFELPSSGLRFFTVYGPYGRPDMAMFIFAEHMRAGKPLPLFNSGKMKRDFTYIEDIVEGVVAALMNPKLGAIYNLGRGREENLLDMVKILSESLDLEPIFDKKPMQLGDVPKTLADITLASTQLGYKPKTDISVGIPKFAEWYLDYQKNQ